ncbi:trace amine-associated receptor 9 [Aplysia californica]|uniref:Trace amine-associated receptor 9 n=1 Tax=Aplysia californica TaxID=6500 RepID=A0ABM0K4U0_APLCA|nr:trace amine-associated receptor 9 [Aplysia californica]
MFPGPNTTALATFAEDPRPKVVVFSVMWISVLYIPVITIGNLLVIATTYLVKKLHTPDNFVLAGLAIADLLVGVWSLPLYILAEIPATLPMIRSQRWTCSLRYISNSISQCSSLSLLILMCVDRFMAINWPFWYQRHVTNTRMMLVMSVIFAIHLTRAYVVYVQLMRFDVTIQPLTKRCTFNSNAPHLYMLILAIEIGVQLLFALCLCAQVSMTALNQARKMQQDFENLGIEMSESLQNRLASVKITLSLMYLFIVLWAPTILATEIEKLLGSKAAISYRLLTRIPRLANSFLNPLVYAFSRDIYRKAYWYLLTTPPNRWEELSRKLRGDETLTGETVRVRST